MAYEASFLVVRHGFREGGLASSQLFENIELGMMPIRVSMNRLNPLGIKEQ